MYVVAFVGLVMAIFGASVSAAGAGARSVTVSFARVELFAASFAVTVTTFSPTCSGTLSADQGLIPVAVPEAPRLVDHVTCVTPTLSLAVPARDTVFAFVVYV